MDAKEESLGTATLSWVCIAILFIVEKPSDKAVTFLMAKNTTHTNQENSAPLSFNFDVIF